MLDEHAVWVQDAFGTHGNGEVIRQELKRKLGVTVSARTVQRAISEPRRRRVVEALATVRFETPPGRQMQADFGEISVVTGGERTQVHLRVLTLGWSQRIHVQAFRVDRLLVDRQVGRQRLAARRALLPPGPIVKGARQLWKAGGGPRTPRARRR